MHMFRNQARQGDVLFIRVDALPNGLVPYKGRKEGVITVSDSETGHDHDVLERPNESTQVKAFVEPHTPDTDLLKLFLIVEGDGAEVVHNRDHHKHGTLNLSEGTWKVIRQRQMTPEGMRRVQD